MAAARRVPKALKGNVEHLATIKDLNPKSIVRHGRHIYFFCNILTKQVLYSFYPGLDDSHLKQLPFLGKKSKPPQVRRDHWKPYCTVTFDTSDQGLWAFRKLRELRKRHETEYDPLDWHKYRSAWQAKANEKKDDTEIKHWSEQTKDERKKHKKDVHRKKIHFLMDQKANSIADLAAVLALQKEEGVWMQDRLDKQHSNRETILNQRWKKIEEANQRANNNNHIEALESQIEDSKAKLETDLDLSEGTRKNLRENIEFLRSERKFHIYAQRKWEELQQAKTEEKSKSIRDSLLPKSLQIEYRTPFSIDNTIIEWAELHDAYYAKEWPEGVKHDVMGPLRSKRPHVPGMAQQEYLLTKEEVEDREEADAIARQEEQATAESEQKFMREEEQPRSGIMKYIPKIRNPFARA